MQKHSSCDKVAGAAATGAELVFIPAPFTGHIVSMVEFAKVLVGRDHRLSITIPIIKLPFDFNANAYADSLLNSLPQPRIRFVPLPPPSDLSSSMVDADDPLSSLFANHKQGVRDVVARLRAESTESRIPLAGFVVDMLCWPMKDVAKEFGVPCYVYFASNAFVFGFSLHLLALQDECGQDITELIDSEEEFPVPTFVNPVPIGKLLPFTTTSKEESTNFLNRIRELQGTKGILVNTFTELESHALDSFRRGIPAGIPPLYPVGPNLNVAGEISRESVCRRDDIMKWLDEQPSSSVVFLCFGSLGSFGEEQVKEIACGLESSGHRFLWSLRQPPPKDIVQPGEYTDPEDVLPEGFLKRTAHVGKVIGWAPQVLVLSHPAIGGLVSHCGWNSVLESLWFGVPIATWPIHAEQLVDAFALVREFGLAIEITVDYKRDLMMGISNFVVKRENIERGIRGVMAKDSKVREKVEAMKEESRRAVIEGGSSYTWLGRFIEDVIANIPS